MFIIGEESKTERRESLLAGDAEAHREENVGMTFICVSLFPVVSCSSFAVRSPLLSSLSVVTSLISSSTQYTSSTIREVYLGFGLWTNEGQQSTCGLRQMDLNNMQQQILSASELIKFVQMNPAVLQMATSMAAASGGNTGVFPSGNLSGNSGGNVFLQHNHHQGLGSTATHHGSAQVSEVQDESFGEGVTDDNAVDDEAGHGSGEDDNAAGHGMAEGLNATNASSTTTESAGTNQMNEMIAMMMQFMNAQNAQQHNLFSQMMSSKQNEGKLDHVVLNELTKRDEFDDWAARLDAVMDAQGISSAVEERVANLEQGLNEMHGAQLLSPAQERFARSVNLAVVNACKGGASSIVLGSVVKTLPGRILALRRWSGMTNSSVTATAIKLFSEKQREGEEVSTFVSAKRRLAEKASDLWGKEKIDKVLKCAVLGNVLPYLRDTASRLDCDKTLSIDECERQLVNYESNRANEGFEMTSQTVMVAKAEPENADTQKNKDQKVAIDTDLRNALRTEIGMYVAKKMKTGDKGRGKKGNRNQPYNNPNSAASQDDFVFRGSCHLCGGWGHRSSVCTSEKKSGQ